MSLKKRHVLVSFCIYWFYVSHDLNWKKSPPLFNFFDEITAM